MNIQELKAKNSKLYDQIKEAGREEARQGVNPETLKMEGVKEGQAVVLSAVESTLGADARAKIQVAIDADLTAEQVGVLKEVHGAGGSATASDFEARVDRVQEQTGCQRSKAIAKVAAENPQLHEDWLRQKQNESRRQILDGLRNAPRAQVGSNDAAGRFETEVNAYQQAHNCRRSEAIQAIAAGNPNLHDAWLRVQQR